MENSDSQFFRTTTGTQSDPNTSEESRLVVAFFTLLDVTGILGSFRFVIERQASKEMPDHQY